MAASTYASVNLKQSTMTFDVQLLSLPTDDNSSTMQALFCLPHHLKDQKEKKIPLIAACYYQQVSRIPQAELMMDTDV